MNSGMRLGLGAGGVACFLVLWELIVLAAGWNNDVMASPVDIVAELFGSGLLLVQYALDTIWRVVVGNCLGRHRRNGARRSYGLFEQGSPDSLSADSRFEFRSYGIGGFGVRRSVHRKRDRFSNIGGDAFGGVSHRNGDHGGRLAKRPDCR